MFYNKYLLNILLHILNLVLVKKQTQLFLKLILFWLLIIFFKLIKKKRFSRTGFLVIIKSLA
jgi:hypothetical protein